MAGCRSDDWGILYDRSIVRLLVKHKCSNNLAFQPVTERLVFPRVGSYPDLQFQLEVLRERLSPE